MKEKASGDLLPINHQIKFQEMQLIMTDGENKGVVSLKEAQRIATEMSLDLVTVSLSGALNVPVVRVMDLNKKLYEEKKKLAQSRKKQHEVQTKEVRMGPKISDHDLHTKLRQATEFLKDGDKVKISIILRGREKSSKDFFVLPLFSKIQAFLENSIMETKKTLSLESEQEGPLGFSKIYFLKK